MLLPVRKPRPNPAKAEPNGKTTSPQRRRERRVQCHGRTPWWKGMGNPEECPQEWGHGSLKGYATVLRRSINELRRGFRREKETQNGVGWTARELAPWGRAEEAENAEEEVRALLGWTRQS